MSMLDFAFSLVIVLDVQEMRLSKIGLVSVLEVVTNLILACAQLLD